MRSVIIVKLPRGLYSVRIIDYDGTLHDEAGFVSPSDALKWAAEFLPLLDPHDENNLSSR